jgi:hypothetical protein
VHFTPTHSSWLNIAERWFSELTNRKLRRSTHRSVVQLEADVSAWFYVQATLAPGGPLKGPG